VTISYDDVVGWIRAFAADVATRKDELTALDSAIGDADHGTNLDRGLQAVVAKLDGTPTGDISALLKSVGMTLVSTVGGAAGPLYGTLFLQLGAATTGQRELTLQDWSTALAAAVRGVQSRGKAEPGDKTMIDALMPATEALAASVRDGASLEEGLLDASRAAEEGMRATVPLVARKGRASYLGERSAGHQDPGATSSHMLLEAATRTWIREP
jgi:phosphoenolpyruvate---glycerone phosphotransferase subunit DhaL